MMGRLKHTHTIMTTTQISRKDDRTPVYYIGLVREGRKLILQAKESVDELSCEITDYLGARKVSKATIEANKGLLLEGFKAMPKYRNCDTIVVEEEQAKYTTPDIPAYKKIAYIERMQNALQQLSNAMHNTDIVWQQGSDVDLDMNDFLTDAYPFSLSFDDLCSELDVWYQKAWVALNRKKKVLQGYPPEKVYRTGEQQVEEPAPYYTPEEVKGKWICAYNTLRTGWDCVRHDGGEKDGYPLLYDSSEEVEKENFFDPDDDFAIPAEEFIEGRRFFFGANGCRVEGTPIVKGYKIEGTELIKTE